MIYWRQSLLQKMKFAIAQGNHGVDWWELLGRSVQSDSWMANHWFSKQCNFSGSPSALHWPWVSIVLTSNTLGEAPIFQDMFPNNVAYKIINNHNERRRFLLPSCREGRKWFGWLLKTGEITGKNRVLYSGLGEITGKTNFAMWVWGIEQITSCQV